MGSGMSTLLVLYCLCCFGVGEGVFAFTFLCSISWSRNGWMQPLRPHVPLYPAGLFVTALPTFGYCFFEGGDVIFQKGFCWVWLLASSCSCIRCPVAGVVSKVGRGRGFFFTCYKTPQGTNLPSAARASIVVYMFIQCANQCSSARRGHR